MTTCVDCDERITDGTRLTLYCSFCRRLHTPFGWGGPTPEQRLIAAVVGRW